MVDTITHQKTSDLRNIFGQNKSFAKNSTSLWWPLHSLAPPTRQSDGHQSLHVLCNFKECLERDCKVGSWTSWTTECRIPGPGLLQCPPRICPWYVMGLPRRDVHDGCGINTRTRKILQHPYCPRALYISGKCKVSCPQTREARSCKCPGGIISNHIF